MMIEKEIMKMRIEKMDKRGIIKIEIKNIENYVIGLSVKKIEKKVNEDKFRMLKDEERKRKELKIVLGK